MVFVSRQAVFISPGRQTRYRQVTIVAATRYEARYLSGSRQPFAVLHSIPTHGGPVASRNASLLKGNQIAMKRNSLTQSRQ